METEFRGKKTGGLGRLTFASIARRIHTKVPFEYEVTRVTNPYSKYPENIFGFEIRRVEDHVGFYFYAKVSRDGKITREEAMELVWNYLQEILTPRFEAFRTTDSEPHHYISVYRYLG